MFLSAICTCAWLDQKPQACFDIDPATLVMQLLARASMLLSMINACKSWLNDFMQDKLAKQQQADADMTGYLGKLSDLESQEEAAEQRILSLKKTVLQNDILIQKLLRLSVGAS